MFFKTALAGLLALAVATPALAKDKIELACSSSGLMFGAPYVAKQLGFFDAAGLDVDIYDANGGGNAVAAVAGGSAQIGLVGYKNMSLAVLKGQPLKAVGTGARGFPQDVVVRPDLIAEAKLSPASPFADKVGLLRKRIIAVNEIGGSSGEFARFLLRGAGIADGDATVINITTPDGRLSALKAKRIDAFIDSSPLIELAVAGGYGVDFIHTAQDLPNLTKFEYLVEAVRADYLKAHPDIVTRYLTALQQALDVIQRDPAKAQKAVFAYLADQASSEIDYPQQIQDQAWTATASSFPKTILLDPDGLKAAHAFFGISDKLADADLSDSTIAATIAPH
jgi:NitT/TauT family transport system substrate-binding protein